MTIRCKFRCDSSATDSQGQKNFLFSAVYSEDPNSENSQFWKYTPCGSLQFSCMNPNVDFVQGKEYYLDINEA